MQDPVALLLLLPWPKQVPICPFGLWRARNTLSTYLNSEKWQLDLFPLFKKNEIDLKIGSHTQPSWPRANPKELYGSRRESLLFPDRRVSGVSIAPQSKKGKIVQNSPLWSHPSYASGNPDHASYTFRKQLLLPHKCEGLRAGHFGSHRPCCPCLLKAPPEELTGIGVL